MKKNLKIGIGVVAVMVIGISAYGMAGGGLLQGKFSREAGVNKSTKKLVNYIESVPLCLKPEEWQKKYPMPKPSAEKSDDDEDNKKGDGHGGSGGGGSTTIDPGSRGGGSTITTDSKKPKSGGSTEESKDIPILKIPEIGTGLGTETIVKIEEIEKKDATEINYVECSCKRQGFEYITKDAKGKDVKNICVVNDWKKCVDPDFLCPEGTEIDYPALNDLCRKKKQKNCFSAMKADTTSKEDAMCKNLIGAYKEPICPSTDECKEYAAWMAAGNYTDNVKKYGLAQGSTSVCNFMYNEGKGG